MFQCCTRWERVEEEPYLIPVDDEGGDSPMPIDDFEDESVDVTGDEGPDALEQIDIADDNWKSMADELDEFMNADSDSEDVSASDSESVRSTNSIQSDTVTASSKRKRGTESNDEGSESDASVSSISRLQRRKKRTLERVTSLTNVVNADKSSGLPSPETTGPEEEQGDEEGGETFDPQGQGADLNSDYDDGLEAEMMAEFERSGSEEN